MTHTNQQQQSGHSDHKNSLVVVSGINYIKI